MRLAKKCKIFFKKFHLYFIFGEKERFSHLKYAGCVQNVQEKSQSQN